MEKKGKKKTKKEHLHESSHNAEGLCGLCPDKELLLLVAQPGACAKCHVVHRSVCVCVCVSAYARARVCACASACDAAVGLPAVMETQHLLKEEKIFELSVSVSEAWFCVFSFSWIYTGWLHSAAAGGKSTS